MDKNRSDACDKTYGNSTESNAYSITVAPAEDAANPDDSTKDVDKNGSERTTDSSIQKLSLSLALSLSLSIAPSGMCI